LYFGLLIVLERTVFERVQKKTPAVLQHIATLFLVLVGFVLFQNESFAAIGRQYRAMFAPWTVPLSDAYSVYALKSNPVLLAAAVIGSLPIRKCMIRRFKKRRDAGKSNAFRPYLKAVAALIVTGLSLMFLVGQSFNPFLYFRF